MKLVQQKSQVMTLAPQVRQSLKMLAMSLPELRAELLREMSLNPAIADIEQTLEKTTISQKENEAEEKEDFSDYPDGDDNPFDAAYLDGVNRHEADADRMERRQSLFDNQTAGETLEEHLLSQLGYSEIEPEYYALAEMLISELDDDGYFKGSIPDIVMVSGESEDVIRKTLAKITKFDPPGCGALTHQECLIAQLDEISDPLVRSRVKALILRHWHDMAEGKVSLILKDLSIDRKEYVEALKALRTLDPRPARAYRHGRKGDEYVNPEVHAVKCSDGWEASVDARSLPEIRISPKFIAMLEDPTLSEQTKEYVREKIAAAQALVDSVERRQETVAAIAQAIFDAQSEFFTKGLGALKPLTMHEIAEKTGVHTATVSRTVNGKYASTPYGTIELRRFFVSGISTSDGGEVSKNDVLLKIKELVDSEDRKRPLSDDKIALLLKSQGFTLARRTVAKYRTILSIPPASERKSEVAGG
jgi:RNA polymerase sigma-54 factor